MGRWTAPLIVALVQLLAGAPAADATFPAPTNGQIAFSSERDGDREIYLMDPSGANQTRFTNDPGFDDRATWSANADMLLWGSDRTGNMEVFQDTPAHTSPANITNNPAIDARPSFTAAGTNPVLFVSNRTGNDEIYSQNRDGSGLVNLTNNPANDSQPNSDGSKIAFVSERDGNREIYVMNLDGSGVARLTNNPGIDQAPNISGNVVMFESDRDGNFEIYRVQLDGNDLENLTNNPSSDREPAWAPDRTAVAFQSLRDGNFEIYEMNPYGYFQARLTNNPAPDVNPDWGRPPFTNHARPKGATPLRVSLVPAYRQCTAPSSSHGAPLAFPSCTLSRSSPNSNAWTALTIGSPDANGAQANSIGSLRLDVIGMPGPPSDADVRVMLNISDVRCESGTSPSVCTQINSVAGEDYSGEVQPRFDMRLTDRSGNESTTSQGFTFAATAACANTSGSGIPNPAERGGVCSLTTTVNAVIPGAVVEGGRAVWQLDQVNVNDGGPDGDVDTPDNGLFEAEGVYAP